MFTTSQATDSATLLRLLADPTRLRILSLLFEEREGLCVYQIADALGLSHSATSHQLAKLESFGVVVCFRDGQTMCYELKKNTLVSKIRIIIQQSKP